MGNWDVTTPAGNQSKSLGDDRIREMKVAIQEALRGQASEGTEAVFPGSAPTTAPVYRYRGLKGTTGVRPAAGQYGLYANTTLNTLQRDNGTSWEDVATLIPSGTKMVFYQASAPVGWTAVAVSDKFLRVVNAGGSGGTTGGTHAASTSLAHSHTVDSHAHNMGDHTHGMAHTHQVLSGEIWGSTQLVNSTGAMMTTNGSGTFSCQLSVPNTGGASNGGITGSPSTNSTSAVAPGTNTQFSGSFAYADIIIATKD